MALKGGYAGVGSTRDIVAYSTIIDGGNGSKIYKYITVTGANGASIDGFTIRGGYHQVYCDNCSPTISNSTILQLSGDSRGAVQCTNYSSPYVVANELRRTDDTTAGYGVRAENSSSPTITGNKLSGFNRAVSCSQGSHPTIIGNVMVSNNAGVGCASGCHPTIAGNVISGCYQGIDAGGTGTAPTITNNTIVNCSKEGIYCPKGTPQIYNNIVAWNDTGIQRDPALAVLSHNDVYGNNYDYYSDRTPGPTDISVDPKFASVASGDYHIQRFSLCRNAGDSSAPGIPPTDMDGQGRIEGSAVDIGADESYGELYPCTLPSPLRVVYVNGAAPPDGNGANWLTAYQTIQAGVDDVLTNGPAEIWVAEGTYNERVVMRSGAHLYGGFVGTEASKLDRDIAGNQTIINAGNTAPGNYAVTGANDSSLDGFTVRGGYHGVYCNNTSPTASNCVITGNACHGVDVVGGSPWVVNSQISSNGVAGVGSISSGPQCAYPRVYYNLITGNGQYGVYVANADTYVYVCWNTISGSAKGIYSTGGNGINAEMNKVFGNTEHGILVRNPAIANNVNIKQNLVYGNGAGIRLESIALVMYRNTVCDNTGNGLDFQNCYSSFDSVPVRADYNVVAFNGVGILSNNGAPNLVENDVYGNTVNYSGITPGATDFSQDPLFADRVAGDYHLTAGSPCIRQGSYPATDNYDLDGVSRDSIYDIGCYEYTQTRPEHPNPKNYGRPRSAVVTALFADSSYVESPDRSWGIRVSENLTGYGLEVGAVATLIGSPVADNVMVPAEKGEKYMNVEMAVLQGSGAGTTEPEPIAMNNKAVGGGDFMPAPQTSPKQRGIAGAYGLNNIGLLVRTWGKVTPIDEISFTIDDGSGVSPKVEVPCGMSPPANGQYVVITGISSCEVPFGNLTRLIRVRDQSDIQVVK